jgi:hypothetical protein
MDACNAANYEFFDSWQRLTQDQKAEVIAQYILSHLIESHAQDEQIRQMEKKK